MLSYGKITEMMNKVKPTWTKENKQIPLTSAFAINVTYVHTHAQKRRERNV